MEDKIKWINERIQGKANGMLDIASRFAAINSYIQRKCDRKEAEWCAKWIYEIMDILDYTLRSQEDNLAIFKELYGVDVQDLRFWRECDYRMGEINEMLEVFDRAVATYGEVKLSVGELIGKPFSQDYDREADRVHNQQKVNEYIAYLIEEEKK